ncbi:MAG: hypothetical protein A4E73_03810 [Syntrophaceae bacterium PtaU1.Bin231]|nr:MAG: hypothetical protein A4E73_03810 [Syntrophaceae bacterium PtaU1.Bin231]
MCGEDSPFLKFWLPDCAERLKRESCGRINCRSRRSAGNAVETEIRQIRRDASGPAAKRETAGTDTGAAIIQ